jgi:hypothetical protein
MASPLSNRICPIKAYDLPTCYTSLLNLSFGTCFFERLNPQPIDSPIGDCIHLIEATFSFCEMLEDINTRNLKVLMSSKA